MQSLGSLEQAAEAVAEAETGAGAEAGVPTPAGQCQRACSLSSTSCQNQSVPGAGQTTDRPADRQTDRQTLS